MMANIDHDDSDTARLLAGGGKAGAKGGPAVSLLDQIDDDFDEDDAALALVPGKHPQQYQPLPLAAAPPRPQSTAAAPVPTDKALPRVPPQTAAGPGGGGGGIAAPSAPQAAHAAIPIPMPASFPTTSAADLVSGTMSVAAAPSQQQQQQQQQQTGRPAAALSEQISTLDEPVVDTILRDLRSIFKKVQMVLRPKENTEILKDWDLWGPLLMCLSLAITLAIGAPGEQTASVFSLAFFIVWVGAGVVTLNSKLLGASISFFQSVCVLGYCIFPLVVSALVCLVIPYFIVRLLIIGAAFGWSTYASVFFLTHVKLQSRRTLAVYPVFLFYSMIAWCILISKAVK